MGIRKNESFDVLRQKQEELAGYQAQFDNAVSVVTRAAQNLSQINANIADKIKEIDEYQTELAKTRAGLDEAKQKNEQVIKNFNALLCVNAEEA